VQRSVGDVITTVQCLFCVHIEREKHERSQYETPTHQEHAASPVPVPTRGLQKSSQISTSRRLDQLSIALASKEGCILQEKGDLCIHNFLDKDSLEFVISRPTVVNDVVGDFFFPSGGRRRKRCVQIDDEGHEVVQTAGGRIIPGDNHELSTIRPRNSARFCWVVVSVDIQGD